MKVDEYLKRMIADKASDLFIVPGGTVCEKVDRRIVPVSERSLVSTESEVLIRALYALSGRGIDAFLESGDDDFSISISGLARFRVNAYKQRGSLAAVVRSVSFDIPDYRELNIPEQVMSLSEVMNGLIVFTGVSGSGKSTTQACLIDRINSTKEYHIITLEDPIEFLHKNKRSLVSQRDIAIDTKDYLTALKSCMRQAPDVILLGEMRDYETIKAAITAAETGHLVIATLHTRGAVNAIDRMIDAFPGGQQEQIRVQLGMVLHTVVSQQLLPDVDGGLIPAYGLMHTNTAVRNLIRDNKSHQIDSVISGDKGMLSMDASILELFRSGRISRGTALSYAEHPEQLERRLS